MPLKLTQLDRKLLYELDINARASLKQLARKTGASKERVHYRIKRLEREKAIVGYRTIINTGGLGYTSPRLYIRLRNATIEKEEEIARFLAEEPHTGWVVTVEGNYDLNCWLLVKDMGVFAGFLKRLDSQFKQYVEKIWISIYDEVIQYPKRFLLDKQEHRGEGLPFITPTAVATHDDRDLAILQALSADARSALITIAKRVGLGAEQTKKRIGNLEKKGIILGYRANINYGRIGYSYYKLLLWLSPGKQEKAANILAFARLHPNLFYTDKMINGADVELEFLTQGKQEMQRIINEFRNAFPKEIARYELQEYPKEHKLVFLPLIEEKRESYKET